MVKQKVFGFLAGLVALLLACYGLYELCHLLLPKREDTDQLTLTERAQQHTQQNSSRNPKHQFQSVQTAEPAVTTTVWPIDDVQPCSSKHVA
ncbi:unnamed protein product [Allacma fusca]|uniref:Uncharacterized protein n=1 Tax=Allacma fusca TaxID=39272 RepID=A0A8J2PVX3_9HEXA|nr:unnamed protein product [Allacma fusca]